MTPTVITTNINAVSPVAVHRAMKNPAILRLISHQNNAGYNEMMTIDLASGFFFADGSTTIDALTTDEFNTAIAGIYTMPA